MIYKDLKSNNTYTANIVIRKNETYQKGIERVLNNKSNMTSNISNYLSL